MTATLDAVRVLALGMGWPLLMVKPNSKEPMTRHGVKDATVDERTLLQWLDRWPEANIAVACGAPGPQVLDIDDPLGAKDALLALKRIHPPTVATTRGQHLYFEGTDAATISLPYGELRGRGSYVLVPPSIHPSGKQYVWLEGPRHQMPVLPSEIVGNGRSAGTGDFDAPELIPHGQRHDALKDAAVRLLRAGYTDAPTLEQMVRLFYETRCVQTPPAKASEFRDIAKWATSTDIARRERLTVENSPMPKPKAKRGKSALKRPPKHDAALTEHREYVKAALGLPEGVDVKLAIRHGARTIDPLVLELSNGQRIRFEQQKQAMKLADWTQVAVTATNGIADPPTVTAWELLQVFRSICVIADAPAIVREEEDLRDALADFLSIAEPLTDFDFSSADGRYNAIAACRARPPWEPRKSERDPVVLVDKDGTRYLRAGELGAYLSYHGLLAPSAVPGRMQELGIPRFDVNGREPSRPDGKTRRTGHIAVYRVPEEW